MFSPKRILVPTDFSEFSGQAFRQAIDLAKQLNAKIYLLHVINEGAQQCVADYCLSAVIMKRIENESIVSTDENLKKEVRMYCGSGDVEIIPILKKGFPEEEIIKEQGEKKIDLIVMASHGKKGFMKHLIGSVAERVMQGATCPVLLVKNELAPHGRKRSV
jgi:nucleotide-binding universal stress UspA family protein